MELLTFRFIIKFKPSSKQYEYTQVKQKLYRKKTNQCEKQNKRNQNVNKSRKHFLCYNDRLPRNK